tara:strand:+ start:98 stop:493 length:396 start_codon:yes stop_codon:yes gene_type:complete
MKLAIIGSRSITDDAKVLKTIHNYCIDNKPSVILKSAGKGIDPTIDHYARANEIDTVNFLPYHLLDPKANFNSKYFFIRTKQLLNNADELIALWDTKSKGTEYAIKYAQKLGIPVKVVKIPLRVNKELQEE